MVLGNVGTSRDRPGPAPAEEPDRVGSKVWGSTQVQSEPAIAGFQAEAAVASSSPNDVSWDFEKTTEPITTTSATPAMT